VTDLALQLDAKNYINYHPDGRFLILINIEADPEC